MVIKYVSKAVREVYAAAFAMASSPEILRISDITLENANEISKDELGHCDGHTYRILCNDREMVAFPKVNNRYYVPNYSKRYCVHVALDTLAGAFNARAEVCKPEKKIDGLNKEELQIMGFFVARLAALSENSIYHTKGAAERLFLERELVMAASRQANFAFSDVRNLHGSWRNSRGMPHFAPGADIALPVQIYDGLRVVK